jgi:hypothetical protein
MVLSCLLQLATKRRRHPSNERKQIPRGRRTSVRLREIDQQGAPVHHAHFTTSVGKGEEG